MVESHGRHSMGVVVQEREAVQVQGRSLGPEWREQRPRFPAQFYQTVRGHSNKLSRISAG